MCIIGGLGSIVGTIFGAFFITMLPVVLRLVMETIGPWFMDPSYLPQVIGQLRLVFFGGLIMTFLIVEPDGLNRLWQNIRNYFRVWPFSY
jgi:branched-chain amino acid transport system permease protein